MKNGLLDDSNKRKSLGIILISVGMAFIGTGVGFIASAFIE